MWSRTDPSLLPTVAATAVRGARPQIARHPILFLSKLWRMTFRSIYSAMCEHAPQSSPCSFALILDHAQQQRRTAVWSSGMILASGARGPGLNSQNGPCPVYSSNFELTALQNMRGSLHATDTNHQGAREPIKVVPRGLEPGTLRLLAVRSNQLSYETAVIDTLSFADLFFRLLTLCYPDFVIFPDFPCLRLQYQESPCGCEWAPDWWGVSPYWRNTAARCKIC